MKTIKIQRLTVVLFLFLLGGMQPAEAQFWKKLGKRAEEAAKETVMRKAEDKAAEKTEKAMDTILNADKKIKKKKKGTTNDGSNESYPDEEGYEEEGYDEEGYDEDISEEFKIYSKFDFVPGNKILLFDDFSLDNIGDFPAKWNANGSGEVVTINDSSEKWLEIKPGFHTYYIPDLPQDLPEEYTIEFDLLVSGVDKKTSSTATLSVILDDNNTFKDGKDYVYAYIPFAQYIAIGVRLKNRISGQNTINNAINGDLREVVMNRPHISIAVKKQRYRLWVNEKKYVDIPRMIGKDAPLKALKFGLTSFKDGKEHLFISNLKVAEGGQDLRSKLLNEGKFSTTGILFNSGSDQIKPESNGVLKQIASALQQEPDMNLNIIGHTDADGNDEDNLTLSQERARSVKGILISQFGIDENRLQTEGKGENEPVSDNTTPEGKANNRRVEFVKL